MNQSKMLVTDTEKKFVIKHVFKDFKNAETYLLGDTVKHFDLPWRVCTVRRTEVRLECLKYENCDKWCVEVDAKLVLPNNPDSHFPLKKLKFRNYVRQNLVWDPYDLVDKFDEYLVDGNLAVEVHVKINKITGIPERTDFFEKKDTKAFSDAVLVVEGRKFNVCKMYLSYHSTYFNALFSGNFAESQKSEIELKGIDLEHFQNFLEVLYGEPAIHEENYEEILKLADMYDAPTAIRRCEDFLMKVSKRSLKEKFDVAIKYKMNDMVKKCISEMDSYVVRSFLPADPSTMEYWIWKELVDQLLRVKPF